MSILSVELVIFTATIYIVYTIKKRRPNAFCLPAGVTIFLPPEEEDLKTIKEFNKNQQKNLTKYQKDRIKNRKPKLPIKILRAVSEHIEKVKFIDDLEAMALLTSTVTVLIIASELIRSLQFFPLTFSSPNLSFYLLASLFLLLISTLFKITSIGGLSIYENRISLIISIISVLVFILILFPARSLINIDFEKSIQRALVHFRSVADTNTDYLDFINADFIVILTLILMLPFTYCLVPVIIKFGNCYTTIMKDLYKEEARLKEKQQEDREKAAAAELEGTNSAPAEEKSKDTASGEEKKEILQTIKDANRTIRWFNISLVFNMIVLFFWVRPVMNPWITFLEISAPSVDPQVVINIMRCGFIFGHIFANFMTYKPEINRYMQKSYDSIVTLLTTPTPENLDFVQRKCRAHFQMLGAASYQICAKFLLPLLLILLYIQKDFAIREQKTFQVYNYYAVNEGVAYLDWNCVGLKDPSEIFRQLASKCPKYKQMELVSVKNGYGWIAGNEVRFEDDMFSAAKEVMRKVNRYGLVHSEFWLMLFSLWLFIYYFIIYILSIIYIVYKRKTEESG